MGRFPGKSTLALFIALAAMVLLPAVLSGCAKTVTPSRPAGGSGNTAASKPEQSGLTASVALTGVHMYDSEHGWLLDKGLYATADGGRHWTKAGPPLAGGDNVREEVVSVAGPRTAWVAVGTSPVREQAWVTLFYTTDGGRSWTKTTMKESLPDRVGGQVPGYLTFADQEHGWLVTQVPEWGMGGTAPGALYRTDDGGKSWRFVALAEENMVVRFTWLCFLDAATGFTVEGRQANADTGVIARGSERLYRTADGGLTWQPSPVPLPAAKFLDIRKPVFFGRQDGILPAVAGDGAGHSSLHLYTTHNAGTTWQPEGQLTLRPSTGAGPTCDFPDAQNGWVYWGGKLYETRDGGRSFTAIETGFKNNMQAQIDFINEQQGWLARWEYALPGTPVILYETKDGGRTWVRQKT